jgi:hypothetical protein
MISICRSLLPILCALGMLSASIVTAQCDPTLLTAADAVSNANFGRSISAWGDIAIVGA